MTRLYGGKSIVSIFEFDSDAATDLAICEFEKPSLEWAQFVMNNRDRTFTEVKSPLCNNDAKYDIVIGPVANDDMALLFRQYADELISLEMLARGMEYRELTNQYSFHTKKAISFLTYIGVQND